MKYFGQHTFTFSDISKNDTLKLLYGLKELKVSGSDKINAELIRHSAEIICSKLTKLFNRSLQTGIFPDDLKNAVVSPIYKNWNKSDCSSNRPISVLSILQKSLKNLFIAN